MGDLLWWCETCGPIDEPDWSLDEEPVCPDCGALALEDEMAAVRDGGITVTCPECGDQWPALDPLVSLLAHHERRHPHEPRHYQLGDVRRLRSADLGPWMTPTRYESVDAMVHAMRDVFAYRSPLLSLTFGCPAAHTCAARGVTETTDRWPGAHRFSHRVWPDDADALDLLELGEDVVEALEQENDPSPYFHAIGHGEPVWLAFIRPRTPLKRSLVERPRHRRL